MAVKLDVAVEWLRLKTPFRITGYVFEGTHVVVATLSDDEHRGRGEAAGVFFLGDDVPAMQAALETSREAIEGGADRAALQTLLPPGGARNAVDCALWELEAARTGRPVWELAGVGPPKPLVTTFTLGADDPATVESKLPDYDNAAAIKLKLDGDFETDRARIEVVRRGRPDVWLGVDANQGYRRDGLDALVEVLVANRVSLLEQPLARGSEADLEGFSSPVPIAADESAISGADLEGLVGRFHVVNIKLDKCGGLTEGLAMARRARELGLGVMVGNMVGSSLAMGPAFVLGQLCDIVDLDGPSFLAEDRVPAVDYRDDGSIFVDEAVWGAGAAVRA